METREVVTNPYEEILEKDRTVEGIVNKSYEYDGTYGPIPDENGFVDLNNYALLYVQNYSSVTELPQENQEYLDSGILPTNMNMAFSGCNTLVTLDLSKLDTSNVTNYMLIFNSLPALTTVSGYLDMDKVDYSSSYLMFNGCPNLRGVHLKNVHASIYGGADHIAEVIGGSEGVTWIIDNYAD